MAWVGIVVLVLAGVIALALSARADRRAAAPSDASEAAALPAEDVGPEPGSDDEAARPAPVSEPVPEAVPEPASVDDEAVRARIEALAAELRSEGQPRPGLEGPAAPGPETTAQEAERVFASVAAVGRPAPEPEAQVEAASGARSASEPEPAAPPGIGHEHERPVANHSDLLAHVRAEHTGISTSGSTIQMRIMHERAHAGQPADR